MTDKYIPIAPKVPFEHLHLGKKAWHHLTLLVIAVTLTHDLQYFFRHYLKGSSYQILLACLGLERNQALSRKKI